MGCLKKKIRTDKLSSLHSFITGTQFPFVFIATSLRYAKYYYCLLKLCGLPQNMNRQQGVLDKFALSHMGKQIYHQHFYSKNAGRTLIILCYTTLLFLFDCFLWLSCGLLTPPYHPIRCSLHHTVIIYSSEKAVQGFGIP